jgi:hypothetical protein
MRLRAASVALTISAAFAYGASSDGSRAGAAQAPPLVYYATASGMKTLDEGEGGGNPFASALIELLARPKLALAELSRDIAELTKNKSRGFQSPEVPIVSESRSLLPAASGERRIALVIVVSDYAKSGGAKSLPGARRDAARISEALRRAGFDTETAIDLDRDQFRERLADYSRRSAESDVAVVYSTGHGVEVNGRVYVLPGDYPLSERNAALEQRALPLAEVAAAPRARGLNLIFYGGCRDDPFGAKRG